MQTDLRKWRGDKRVEDVAAQMGVTTAMWSRWETGSRPVPALRVLDLEKATGVSRHILRPDVFGEAPKEQAA